MSTTRQPVRATTRLLLGRLAADFDANLKQVITAAVQDGEVASGTDLDLTQGTPVWLIPIHQDSNG